MKITASLPDGTSFSDHIDVTSATGRKRFENGLCEGREGIDRAELQQKLNQIASEVIEAAGSGDGDDQDGDAVLERAAYADSEMVVELAWNVELASADFIIYDRVTGTIERSSMVKTAGGVITVPSICPGIVTPGYPIEGAVYLPADCDWSGRNEAVLRSEIEAFINRYVELPAGAVSIAVEYVFLTWVHDRFDELPYLAFRTADSGRGKSRALETVGALCYRPMIVGGGSSAAAMLRMLDAIGGTLLSDEFDATHNTELAAEMNRILNQGFQRCRPLVKCDGENNTPRPFRCFGPKVFALRSRLGDDATESRTISVRMVQRTREDIPLSLPRPVFDAQALALRNKLLGWRFENLNRVSIKPALADPCLDDRANQIGLPLLSVASPETRSAIVEALRDQQATISAARGDSLPGEVFAAVLAVAELGGTVRPGNVAAEVNRRRAEQAGVDVEKLGREKVTSQKVGRVICDTLELPRGPRDNRGAVYVVDPVRCHVLAKRFGVALPETSQTPHQHSTRQSAAENPGSDSASVDCDVSDDSDVSPGSGDDDSDDTRASGLPGTVEVPEGWTPKAWARELRRMADVCGARNPQAATEYRRQADAICAD